MLVEQVLRKIFKTLEMQNIVRIFIQLIFMLHLICSCLITASFFELNSDENWINSAGLTDAPKLEIYMAALYWATVSCTTVGYGDIVPRNKFEVALTIVVLNLGVAYFSWILSQLATRFKELSDIQQSEDIHIKQIDNLARKHDFDPDLVTKLKVMFSKQKTKLEQIFMQQNQFLLRVLPSDLKVAFLFFIYTDIILKVKFLQFRSQYFYGTYLN